jgi:two-component system LytT family sensor kinase
LATDAHAPRAQRIDSRAERWKPSPSGLPRALEHGGVAAYCQGVKSVALGIGLGAIVIALGGSLWYWRRGSHGLGTPLQRTTYDVLHTAGSAARGLRAGLTRESAARSAPALRSLLAARATAITGPAGLLAWDGPGIDHAPAVLAASRQVRASGKALALGRRDLACADGVDCPVRSGVVVPLTSGGVVVGTLVALAPTARAGLLRAAGEVARFASTQLELAELDNARTRAAEAELRFLRAQISPHFVYNALTAIASFMRSDPDRARDLLLGFADFIRYSFRNRGQFATLADELRAVDAYLELERARFGDRLQVVLRIAPEVLPVAVPCLLVQPLVENAVRHGLEHKEGVGHLTIVAEDGDVECILSVEDDGVGMDPDKVREQLSERRDRGVGLVNVDERLRQVFGADHGITVETAIGAGTKVTVRLPKYQAGVRAS